LKSAKRYLKKLIKITTSAEHLNIQCSVPFLGILCEWYWRVSGDDSSRVPEIKLSSHHW
jgi:hypothetical protein